MYAPAEKNKTSTATVAPPVTGSFFKPAPQAAPPVPQHGPNPSFCFACDTLAHPTPTCLNDPKQCAQTFKTDTMACLTANAPASNATKAADILTNTSTEIDDQIAKMDAQYPSLTKQQDKRDYISWLMHFCQNKSREVWIEFNYNIVFENIPGQHQWAIQPDQWDPIENAIKAIPDEHLWGRDPALPVVRFRRENLGPPSPTGSGVVGGETDAKTGVIDIFDAGVSSIPYSRSKNIGVSGTDQTLRHEVGHIVDATVPLTDMQDFFKNIVQWNQYSLAWVTPHPAPYPNWAAERKALCTELNFVDNAGQCDDVKMDAFLASARQGSTTVNGREYTANQNFVNSWPVGNVPSTTEFDYARTSQGEYFAEIYGMALSAPSFLSKAISPGQVQWLKDHVFHTEALYRSIIVPYKRLAINASPSAQYQALIDSSANLFTEQQLKDVARQLDALLTQMSMPQPNA